MEFTAVINSLNKGKITVDDFCPNCQKPVIPHLISSNDFSFEVDKVHIAMTFRCPSCKHFWVEEFIAKTPNPNATKYDKQYTFEHLVIKPEFPSDIPITDEVSLISPVGKEIYTQSLKAEQECLNHIAGIGFRKALEFFVKDFVIVFNQSEKDKISKMPLKQVIDTYIDDDSLKTFATATVYIGNDETHYLRKHDEKDLQDLKRYLRGFLHHMDMKLSFLDAHDLVNPQN